VQKLCKFFPRLDLAEIESGDGGLEVVQSDAAPLGVHDGAVAEQDAELVGAFTLAQVPHPRYCEQTVTLALGLMDQPVAIPWWRGRRLRLTTYNGPTEAALA
jgi:hypothetical protein